MRLSGSCRTKQKLLQGLSRELEIRLLQRLWLGAEYSCEDQVVGVRGHKDVVAVRCQPHDSCPRSRVKDHRIRLATLSFLTHSRQHATRISPSDCTGANPRSCKINWKAVGTPRKVAPNGEGRRGLHIIKIYSSQEPSPRCQPQQNNRGPPKTPERQPRKGGEKGEEEKGGGTKGAAPEREKPTREGSPGAPRISPSRALFPRLVQV